MAGQARARSRSDLPRISPLIGLLVGLTILACQPGLASAQSPQDPGTSQAPEGADAESKRRNLEDDVGRGAGAMSETLPMFRLVWLPVPDGNETQEEKMIGSKPMMCVLTPFNTPESHPGNFSKANESFPHLANSTPGGNLNSNDATSNITQWNRTDLIHDRTLNSSSGNVMNTTRYAWWNCTQDFSSVPTNNSIYDTTELLHSEKSDFAKTVASTPLTVGDVVTRTSQLNFASSVASPSPDISPSDALSVSSTSVLPVLSLSLPSAHIKRSPSVILPLSNSASDAFVDETSPPMVANGYLTSFPAESQLQLATSMIGSGSAATYRNQFVHSSLAHDINVDGSVTLETLSSLDLSYDLAPSVTLGTLSQTEVIFPVSDELSITGSSLSLTSVLYSGEVHPSSSVAMSLAFFEEPSSPDLRTSMSETPPLSSSSYSSQSVSTEPPRSSLAQRISPSKSLEWMSTSGHNMDGREEFPQGDGPNIVYDSSSVDISGVTNKSVQEKLIVSSSIHDDTDLLSSFVITKTSSEWLPFSSSAHPVVEPPSLAGIMSQYKPSSIDTLPMMSDVIYSSDMDTTFLPSVSYDTLITSNQPMQPTISASDQINPSVTQISETSMATRIWDPLVSTIINPVQPTEPLTDRASALRIESSSASSALFSSLEWQSEFVILPSSIDSLASAPSLYTSSPISPDSGPHFSTANLVSPTSVYAAVESTGPQASSPVLASPSESQSADASASSPDQSGSLSVAPVASEAPAGSSSVPTNSSPLLLPTTTLPPIPETTTISSHPVFPVTSAVTTSKTSNPISTSSPITYTPSSSPSPSSPRIKDSTIDAIPDTSILSQSALPITSTPTLPVLTNTPSVILANQTSTDYPSVTSVQQSGTETVSEFISTASATTSVVHNKETSSSLPSTSLTTSSSSTTTTIATTITGSQLTTTNTATTIDNKQTNAVTNEPTTTPTIGDNRSTSEKVVVTTTDFTTSTTSASTQSSQPATTTKMPLPVPALISTETPLNTTDSLMEYWLKTVIEENTDLDVTNVSFISDMELRLASIYEDGFHRLEKNNQRGRRATTVGDTTLQMVNVTREVNNRKLVTMLYYMERYGNITPALQAVAAMDTFNIQEITLRLGHIVVIKAEVYAPPAVVPPHDPKLWLIAAVLGGIVGFILLIWCILFTYCKCTQPIKQRQRTPRTPRSTRISMTGEYDTNSYRNKMPKIQGFDIARTEVGLENEIQRDLKRKPPEPYRRRPDGSTELEGMYSAGETPPPKQPGDSYSNTPPSKVRESGEGEEVTPVASLNMNKSRSQIPIDASLRRSLPPRPDSMETLHPPKKKSSRKKRGESEDSESEDEVAEDRKPLSTDWQERKEKKAKKKSHRSRQEEKPRSKAKKKHRKSDDVDDQELDSSQAGVYENISKVSRADPSRPEKLRSTQHAIKLPPLITQPLVGEPLTKSLREETELQESLQQKADIERWRNKQRQRERTKGSKSGRTHPDGNPNETRHAYRKAQKEIAAILGDPEAVKHMPDVFQRKKKRRHHKPPVNTESDTEPGPSETRKMARPKSAQYSSNRGPVADDRRVTDLMNSIQETFDRHDLPEVRKAPLQSIQNAFHNLQSLIDDVFSQRTPRRPSARVGALPQQDNSPPLSGADFPPQALLQGKTPGEDELEESESDESSDEDGSFLDDQRSNEPSLEEARQRMHELVDNAFALISPRYRKHNRVAPSHILPPRGPAPLPAHGKASAKFRRRLLPPVHRGSRLPISDQDQGSPNHEEDAGPKHTPLYITSVSKTSTPSGQVMWSPYNATDEVALISDDQHSIPGVIQTTPSVNRRLSEGSDSSLIKPVRSVTAYNYNNPAYVNDSDENYSGRRQGQLDPLRFGSQSLANTSLSQTTTTNSSGAESGSIKTPRDLRNALQHDGYTSIYMDSSHLNPKAGRSHSPPERDSHVISLQSLEDSKKKSDFVAKENEENAKHSAQNGIAKVLPLGSQGSLLQSGESLGQSNGPLHMLSEQTSLRLPSTEVLDISSQDAQKKPTSKEPTEIRLRHLDPKIPKLCENGEVDEIDVIQRALKKSDSSVQSHWNKSLRSELERLANHSSADTTITTAMV